ncbi:uncharacterized protein B0P05DRAFT_538507 [Gilbertella persicaria]|uniref:uncharacterized protein n=1 Tax=Gilbertella persicaria TaxID=101096 RepID=UPI0022203BFD|nr:uncharacterized protein B0P05DRAFT_538507 [Gilbertella persicaria]KAI8081891.1 hypothetical protein B0P05DRAFT_538507 [Gilbertella persicaria]
MTRKNPCKNCKQRHRKCERVNDLEPCKRCIQANRKCIPSTLVFRSQGSDEEEDLDVEELQIQFCSTYNLIRQLGNQVETLEADLAKQKALIKNEPQWHFDIVNGQLRLQSDIKTIRELLQYRKAFIRYISPFGNTFDKKLFFDPEKTTSTFLITVLDMFRTQGRHHSSSDSAAIAEHFAKGIRQFVHPRTVVGQLVDAYFCCYTESIPILHEPSFRKHFSRLKEPLNDPVTLAICASTSLFTCHHSFFNSQEKRYIGEYFYKLCMDVLLDIFDDPDRALETMTSINLIQPFMFTTFRSYESQKWNAIALLIAGHLGNELQACCQNGIHFDEATRIRHAIIYRNVCIAAANSFTVDYNKAVHKETLPNVDKLQFDVLPDESKKARYLMQVSYHLSGLKKDSLYQYAVRHTKMFNLGGENGISFEVIIEFENMITKWWKELPNDLKICKEPYSLTQEVLESCICFPKIFLAYHVYTIMLEIQCCFIHSVYRKDGDKNDFTFVLKRAMHLFKYLAMSSLSLLRQMKKMEDVCYCKSI